MINYYFYNRRYIHLEILNKICNYISLLKISLNLKHYTAYNSNNYILVY